jgi:hypothetical protein
MSEPLKKSRFSQHTFPNHEISVLLTCAAEQGVTQTHSQTRVTISSGSIVVLLRSKKPARYWIRMSPTTNKICGSSLLFPARSTWWCLWPSFGYFDAATNRDVLQQINAKLTPEGKFVLDIYNRNFFEDRLGSREFVRDGVTVTEQKTMVDDRLTVRLSYVNRDTVDVFEWQLYTPAGIREVARETGFRCLVSCAGYDEDQSPTSATPRMQWVFEKQYLSVDL